MGRPLDDLTGQVFGRLTVRGRDSAKARKAVGWVCACTCGAVKTVTGSHLRSGRTVSCGCQRRERMAAGPRHPARRASLVGS